MKKIIPISALLLSVVSLVSCGNNDDVNKEDSVVKVSEDYQSEFDKYLNKILVEPYNISFVYRYDDIETNQSYQLVPASFEKSVKMANLLKYLCLDAYNAVAPKGFMKKYFPKMLFLIGSPGYNPNGTILLGTAEAGRKIVLYNVNALDESNVEQLNERYFRTIYHEFSHILHQNIDVPKDYRKITSKSYKSGSWNTAWRESSSLEAGFISDYASSDHHEDFVEMIAHYISYTPEQWNAKLEEAKAGKALLEQKIDLIKSYMKNIWNIDLDALRDEVNRREAAISSQNLDNITL